VIENSVPPRLCGVWCLVSGVQGLVWSGVRGPGCGAAAAPPGLTPSPCETPALLSGPNGGAGRLEQNSVQALGEDCKRFTHHDKSDRKSRAAAEMCGSCSLTAFTVIVKGLDLVPVRVQLYSCTYT
jgi:hypothetical protein